MGGKMNFNRSTSASATAFSFAALDETVSNNQRRRQKRAELAKQKESKKNIIILSVVCVFILFSAIIIGNHLDNARFARVYDLPTETVVVHSGDTIDAIAAAHPVDGLSAHELGIVISDINQGNHSTPLMPGDKLEVPVDNN